MRLSPLDIKKQEFSRTIRRGYDPDEVQAFLDMLAGQWEDLLAEQRRTEDKVRELKAKMEHYEKVEEALQEALRTARESSQQTLENAKQEAALIVKAAAAEAEDLARDAVRRRDALQQEADDLIRRRDEIVARLRAFLTAESEMLERYEDRNAESVAPALDHASSIPLTPAPPETVEEAHAEDAPPPEAEAIDEEAAEDVAAEDVAAEDVAMETEEQEAVSQETIDEEPATEEPVASEIEVEVIDEAPAPEIEVEVIKETPKKKNKARKKASAEKAKKDDKKEEAAPAFFADDVPNHFSDDEEPLSFRFFEPNEEEADPAKFMQESEEMAQFAPLPEDAARKNGRLPRSEDREPSDSTWIVRPVVSSQGKAKEGAAGDAAGSQSDEIDKIRRILSDLD